MIAEIARIAAVAMRTEVETSAGIAMSEMIVAVVMRIKAEMSAEIVTIATAAMRTEVETSAEIVMSEMIVAVVMRIEAVIEMIVADVTTVIVIDEINVNKSHCLRIFSFKYSIFVAIIAFVESLKKF
jgi:hypothetical protein